MTGRCLRQRPRICYYEADEPNLDDFFYCDKCGDLVYEYCSIHGPLLVIPDTKVTAKPNVPSYVPRAALTIPNVFLHLAPSSIPEAGLGVFATMTLPASVRFGPYTGERTDGVDSYYCWQIYDNNRKPSYCIDAADSSLSNWMRYVNCARHWSEQNLVAYQYQGQLYYRTIKIIPRYTELLVFYGSELANELDIDLGKYNSPLYARVYSVSNKIRVLNSEDSNITQEKRAKVEDSIVEDICNKSKDQESVENVGDSYIDINNYRKNNDSMIDTFKSNDENTKQNNGIFDLFYKNKPENNTPVMRSSGFDNSHILSHICNTCNEKFIVESDLEKHMRFHDQNRIHECNICSYRLSSIWNLRRHTFSKHQINYPNLKIQACEICKNKFNSTNSLKNHMRTHTGEKPFSCETCKNKYTSRSNLKKHMRTHTGEKPFSCETCKNKYTSRSNLKKHMRTHTGEKPFSCETCKNKFTSRSNLKNHMRTHTGEKPFSCETCKNKYTSRSNLKNHMRTHTGEKPFSCETCKNKYTSRSNLKHHMRTHTGEKPFSCETCKNKYTSRSNLKKHMRTHTGEKPFSCETCKNKYTSRSNLKNHMRTHTGEKPFLCDTCKNKFASKNGLRNHIRTHMGEKPFSCGICHTNFSARRSLKKHNIRMHTVEKHFFK